MDPASAQLLGGILAQIHAAPLATAHEGVRRIEVHWEGQWGPESFAYRERVQVDGQGGYALETLEPLTPLTMEVGQFLVLQHTRAGFFFRYRDVALRDLGLLAQNFQIVDGGTTVKVAGRDALHLALIRTTGETLRHDLAVDVGSGLILSSRTSGPNGELVSLVEYESFVPGVPAVMQPHLPTNRELVLPPGPALDAALGFTAKLPSLLPEGYALLETARLVDPFERVWLKATYTDGVDVAFYLTRPAALAAVATSAPAVVAVNRSVQPGPTFEGPPALLHAYRAAGIQVLQGTHAGREVIAVGRAPLDDLHWMIESVFD